MRRLRQGSYPRRDPCRSFLAQTTGTRRGVMKVRRFHAASLLTALATALTLGGCGSDDDDDHNSPPVATPAPAPAPAPQAKSCAELNGLTVAAAEIGLPTSGAVVTGTEVVPAAGAGVAAVGEYCKVLGDINPVDPNAPPIKFQVNLPASWNGKA